MNTMPGPSTYAAYGAPHASPMTRPIVASPLSRPLWALVAVIGAAVFAVGFGLPVAHDVAVLLAVGAGVIAAVELIPGPHGHGGIAVALAITGFSDAIAAYVDASTTGWAQTAVVVLSGL